MKFISKRKTAALLAGAILAVGALTGGCSGNEADANVIRIGVVSEMTGANATYGNSIVNGIQLAVKEQNAKGGILNIFYLTPWKRWAQAAVQFGVRYCSGQCRSLADRHVRKVLRPESGFSPGNSGSLSCIRLKNVIQ